MLAWPSRYGGICRKPDFAGCRTGGAEVHGWAAYAINFGLDWRQPGTMLVDGVSPVLKRPRVITTARAPIARNAKARNISAEGISRVGVFPRKGSRKREELSIQCIKIATSTAPPDALNANPIHCERPISIRMKIRGEALVQLTRKSRSMPGCPQNSDTDCSDPWGHDLLQAGLKKSAPAKFLEKRPAQQVVAKHPGKQPGQNSGMPVPVGEAIFRKLQAQITSASSSFSGAD